MLKKILRELAEIYRAIITELHCFVADHDYELFVVLDDVELTEGGGSAFLRQGQRCKRCGRECVMGRGKELPR